MFRVLLADDEVLALEGLQTLIDWNACGFEVAAVARDGAQALEQLRLTRIAQALLEQPEISAQELALQAGFYDYPTFYKWFKSKYGCSPDQYRLMHARRSHEHRCPKVSCRQP